MSESRWNQRRRHPWTRDNETEGIAFKFSVEADTSYDSVKVGSDNAFAVGFGVGIIPFTNNADAIARNNLEIKKNQNSGECACCQALDSSSPAKTAAQVQYGADRGRQ